MATDSQIAYGTLFTNFFIGLILFVFYIWTLVRAFRLLPHKKGSTKILWVLLIVINILGGQLLGIPFLLLAILVWTESIQTIKIKVPGKRNNQDYSKGYNTPPQQVPIQRYPRLVPIPRYLRQVQRNSPRLVKQQY